MNKEFVPYTEALALKQLGFDEPCFGYWSNWGTQEPFLLTCELGTEKESCYIRRKNYLCKGPTYSKTFRWFREKHQIVCVIDFYNDGDLWEDTMYTVAISEFEHFKSHDSFVQFEYKTYEEAELACLRKLIEIVKNK